MQSIVEVNAAIRVLRWVALAGVVAVLLQGLYGSFPLRPRQGDGLVWLALASIAVVVVSLALMPRAAGTLVRHFDLLVPLVLLICAQRLLGWMAGLPFLGALLNPSFPLKFFNMGFAISFHFLLGIALAVACAAWTTAAVLNLVRAGNGDPCAVLPSAWGSFGRVLGLEFIGWAVVFLITSVMLGLMPALGWVALVPMLAGVVVWNLATAAVLPVALEGGAGFWRAFGAGVLASLMNLRRWWLLLLAQMLLLGIVIFHYSSRGGGGSRHTNVSWNVNAFWIGGYEAECRWHGKLTEVYHTAQLPFVEILLTLLFSAMAVAIKIAIVQRLQPETPPVLPGGQSAGEA